MKRFHSIFLSICASLSPAVASPSPDTPATRPNIVFILLDDLRWDALGCMGHPFLQTPNIDRIAEEGMMFRNAFTTISVCGPSRAGFLTGTYPQIHGVERNEQHRDPNPALPNAGQLMQQAGYETAFIGKWHMAHTAAPRPGFNHWVSFEGQGVYIDPPLNENGHDLVKQGYMTDILNDYAVNWLNQPHEKPFMLYLSHKAVHLNFTPAERHKKQYAGAQMPEPLNWQDDLSDKPEWQRAGWAWEIMRKNWLTNQGSPIPEALPPGPWDSSVTGMRLQYFQTLSAVDDSVGDIFQTLEKTGQLDNTIILFTSDNGFRIPGADRINSDKRTAHEESMRIPFIVRYPRLIKPGSESGQMILNIDLLPTLLDLAEADIPEHIQGSSFRPLLAGTVPADWRTSFFYEYFAESWVPGIPGVQCVRTDTWKYMAYPDIKAHTELYKGLTDMDELYNLANDPNELKNLAANPEYSSKLQELKKELVRQLIEIEKNRCTKK
jgi:N-acetylglucosamine-6-sulfatase